MKTAITIILVVCLMVLLTNLSTVNNTGITITFTFLFGFLSAELINQIWSSYKANKFTKETIDMMNRVDKKLDFEIDLNRELSPLEIVNIKMATIGVTPMQLYNEYLAKTITGFREDLLSEYFKVGGKLIEKRKDLESLDY